MGMFREITDCMDPTTPTRESKDIPSPPEITITGHVDWHPDILMSLKTPAPGLTLEVKFAHNPGNVTKDSQLVFSLGATPIMSIEIPALFPLLEVAEFVAGASKVLTTPPHDGVGGVEFHRGPFGTHVVTCSHATTIPRVSIVVSNEAADTALRRLLNVCGQTYPANC